MGQLGELQVSALYFMRASSHWAVSGDCAYRLKGDKMDKTVSSRRKLIDVRWYYARYGLTIVFILRLLKIILTWSL
jgi:hypothetical protein